MNLRSYIICLYLLLIYWVSHHEPSLNMLFFPTLGAFSYLFISRSFQFGEFCKMIAGAATASLISSGLFLSMEGLIPFIAATVFAILLIRKFKLNAPPILSIALIPFFSQPVRIWTLPLAVLVSLSGLLITLSAVELVVSPTARYSLAALWSKRKKNSLDTMDT